MIIQQIAHHRNGVCGAPFYAIRFADDPGNGLKNFLATVFQTPHHCAVICLDLIDESGVTFGDNSWRGDVYEHRLRDAIAKHEEALLA